MDGQPAPQPTEVCPLCGGPVKALKCKVVCQRCGALVANCNGD